MYVSPCAARTMLISTHEHMLVLGVPTRFLQRLGTAGLLLDVMIMAYGLMHHVVSTKS